MKELTHFLEMEKIEFRTVIKYLYLKGMSPSEIHKNMVQTLGKDGHHMPLLSAGLPNSSVVETASKMNQGQRSRRK